LTFCGNLIVGTAYGMIIYNATNSQVYNNTIIANLETSQDHCHAAFLGWGTSSPVYHCGLGTTGFDNNKIYNNIFYGIVNIMIPRDVQITYKDGTSINYSQGDLWEDNVFKNNIIYHPKYSSDHLIRLIEYTTGTHVYWDGIGWEGNYGNTAVLQHGLSNYLDLENQWNCYPAISDLNVDPLFVEPLWTAPENYGDWNLQADSVAVNGGIPVADYTYNLSGNEIQGNPDIGAF
jgi:hypothetical protein